MKIKVSLEALLQSLTESRMGMNPRLQEEIAMGIEKEVDRMARIVSVAYDAGIVRFHIKTGD